MRRRRVALAALGLGLGLAGMTGGGTLTAPAHADPKPTGTIKAEAFTSSSAGLLGCVRPTESFFWTSCIVAYRLPDQQVAVRVLATGRTAPDTPIVLIGMYAEEAVLPASAMSVGGDLAYPVVRLSVPAGALPRTGPISLRGVGAGVPRPVGDSVRCIGPVPGPLKYGLASDSASRSIATADVTGTWNGIAVAAVADQSCTGVYATVFREPVSGAWSWAQPLDDGLW